MLVELGSFNGPVVKEDISVGPVETMNVADDEESREDGVARIGTGKGA